MLGMVTALSARATSRHSPTNPISGTNWPLGAGTGFSGPGKSFWSKTPNSWDGVEDGTLKTGVSLHRPGHINLETNEHGETIGAASGSLPPPGQHRETQYQRQGEPGRQQRRGGDAGYQMIGAGQQAETGGTARLPPFPGMAQFGRPGRAQPVHAAAGGAHQRRQQCG